MILTALEERWKKQKLDRWDLHGYPVSVLCPLLVGGLLKKLGLEGANGELPAFCDIIVVTGKGFGVLQKEVPNFLWLLWSRCFKG